MAEQVQIDRQERPQQVRYRYLADFNSQQNSPNLRKNYRDSVSRWQKSNPRRSPPQQRYSPVNSSHKRPSRVKRFSPSCSTFNPRRETTLEQFSPYDDRGVKEEEERLYRELKQQNNQLRCQLMQTAKLAQSLKVELARRDSELLQCREASQADLRYFQKIVAEMTGQIQIILTKNKILQNELLGAKTRQQEEQRRHDDFVKVQQERRKIEQRRREEHSKQERKNVAQTTIPLAQTRRSVGKLMSRPTHQYDSKQPQALGGSKIKIQEDSEAVNQSNCENKRTQNLPPQQPNNQKENKKGEELIESILSMQQKITGSQAGSLKQLWKWLKGLGHSQSCLRRWKSRAESANNYFTSERLRELIKQACSYIQ